MASNIVMSTQEYAVVGTRPIRHDGREKVTGEARYGADIMLPGLLHGKVLRSPHAHARIRSIDTSRAEALPGVRAVVTAADFPRISGQVSDLAEGAMVNMGFVSDSRMAVDKALFKGHPVAAVAASSPHEAEEALSLIDVDYEVLSPVLDVLEAMKPEAPILHARLANLEDVSIRPGGLRSEGEDGAVSNIANHYVFEIGDPEQGLREAEVVIEQEYRTATVHQGYIEAHTATASWAENGSLTIWCSSQGHFTMRDQTARLLGIPVSRVRVIPLEIGGGFGGKTLCYVEPIAAALSRKAGRPVKVTMNRTEVFESTGPAPGTYLKVKLGARRDGRITFADATLVYEAGAYPGSPINQGCQCIFAPYDLANARVEGYDVVVNKPKTTAYRAPGSPQAAFAMETAIDELCEKLGMDPLEFRLLNGAKEGSRRVTGPRFPRIGYLETVQAAKDHEHCGTRPSGPNRGRGVASGFWFTGSGPACAIASVNADGTVSLVEGSPDIGGSRVVLAMQAAEVLGIPAEDVHPLIGDTDSVGWTSNTAGSGVAFKTGWACYEAAQDVKRQMIERAAKVWDISSDQVDYSDGVLSHKSDPELRYSFKELACMLNSTGGPIVGRGNLDPKGQGGAFATHVVDVEVEPDTGKVKILRYTSVQDAGKAVHPSYVEGQMQGGVVQGIGWALNEEYFFNGKGEMTNSSFLDYRMPTSLDIPMIDTVIVEVANPGHPYGVRGVGEVSIVPPMAAIANAIYDAVGVRMRELPMSPGNILEALWEKDQK